MDTARIQFQRDFYHLLLNLEGEEVPLSETLTSALKLIADISDAEKAYLEVNDANGNSVYQAISIPDEEIPNLQETVSTGIIAEAIRTREAILIPSALIDPRFQTRESVQRLAIESVLCVPFFGSKTQGVLYLQGDRGFKDDAEKIQLDAELFSTHVSPLLDRLLTEQERSADSRDAFATLRDQYQLDGVVGESEALLEVLKSAMMVAPLDVTTLLLGETGTGKTQLAGLMHQNSNRSNAPFVEVNCAALPETLIENELFGAVPGGHSSATQPVTGKITAANTGTLFLDEIGELPLESQAKLLQFIQSGQYYPLGSSDLLTADVRLVFATNKDLREEVTKGSFREDLYFRINTFELTMPTLGQRRSDIPLLANAFLDQCANKHQFPPMRISQAAMSSLESLALQGNMRGLNSTIERACIKARLSDDDELKIEHLPEEPAQGGLSNSGDFQAATLSFQEKLLREKLAETNWNISRTARELNLSRSHVHNLINTFHLKRDSE